MFAEKRFIYTAIMIIAAAVLIYFFYRIKIVLVPFILGIGLAYLFNPVIVFLEERNFSRNGAILLLSIGLFNIFFVGALFLFPLFLEELHILNDMIPEYIKIIEETIADFNRHYERLSFPPILKESFDQVLADIEAGMIDYIHRLTELLLISIPLLVSLLVSPVISFYILRDNEIIREAIRGYFPEVNNESCLELFTKINGMLVEFIRGQIWISAVVAVLIGIGLFVLRIRFALVFALLAGVTNLIPYIGPVLALLPVVFVTFLNSGWQTVAVIILYTAVQQIESIFITPKIMSIRVGLHPLTVIFSMLVGAELLGILGLLLAVPVAGGLKVFLNHIHGQFEAG